MQIIAPLASGVNGAESGYAFVRRRGTNTTASVYSDFYGTVLAHPSTGLVLDSNGGLEVYVNELVDVEVQDSTGTTVRSFVAGEGATNVEYVGPAFTGTDYDTATSAVNEPTTVKDVLDAWEDSAGAPDWEVMVGGTATSLEVALAATAGLFVNVKDPTYGAEGDGATDDTTAIQAALTAAAPNRAQVYFPAGTYKITSALDVPLGVNLWGAGAMATRISMAHATNNSLEFSQSNSGLDPAIQVMQGLQVAPSQANTGTLIYIPEESQTYTQRLRIQNCVLGDFSETYHSGKLVDQDDGLLFLDGVYAYARNATQGIDCSASGPPTLWIRNSIIYGKGSFSGSLVRLRLGSITDTSIVLGDLTTSTIGVECVGNGAGAGPRVSITGCDFYGGASGSRYAISATNGNETTTRVYETGNRFDDNWTAFYQNFSVGTNNPVLRSGSRDGRVKTATDNSATYDCGADQYEVCILTHTSDTATEIRAQPGQPGSKFTLIFVNGTVGSHSNAISFNSTPPTSYFYNDGVTFGTIASGNITVRTFISVRDGSGGAIWVPLAATLNDL